MGGWISIIFINCYLIIILIITLTAMLEFNRGDTGAEVAVLCSDGERECVVCKDKLYMNPHTHIQTRTRTCTNAHIHTPTQTHKHMHAYTQTNTLTHTHIYI